MRSYEVWIAVFVLFLAGGVYAATEQGTADINDNDILIENIPPITFDSYIGANHSVTLNSTSDFIKEECRLKKPNEEQLTITEDFNHPRIHVIEGTDCGIKLDVESEDMSGEWVLIGRYRFFNEVIERRLSFTINIEDPKNPINDTDRRVVNLTAQRFETSIGSSFTVTTTLNSFVTRQSCHVRTPDGLQYHITDGFNIPGVEVVQGTHIECGLNITLLSENMVGDWILISRVLYLGEPIERRLPFTVYVGETVSAFPESISVAEGNSVFVRLMNPTTLYDTCKLIGPNENERHHEVDATHNEFCGFIIRNAQQTDNGEWNIVYGNNIIYRAYIEINVIARQQLSNNSLVFIKDTRVSLEFGPEDAVFCKIEDPTGLIVFDGFGKCNIVLERVTMEHYGHWKMFVGLPGQVFVKEENFLVTVKEGESKAVVSTRVVRERPTVILTCSVDTPHQVRACVFRNPKGEIRVAAQGVGEDRYISQSSQVTYESDVHGHECGLRITEPTSDDLGLWRCAIETEGETHYGFLTALCPWLMQDPQIQESVVTEPVLSSDRTSVTSVEGDATTMSCTIQASIKYCYFRAQNGTVFGVTPATSTASMEYVGNGFDAGDCGIRFKNLLHRDSGRWSCHVGLVNGLESEQRSQFQVTVQEAIVARHYRDDNHDLLVEAVVHADRQLEYCRFVRIDGLGFITGRIPSGYIDLSSLQRGICLLHIEEATILNLHPWTVFAKVRGQDVELSASTTDNLLQFEIATDSGSISVHVWITIALIGLAVLLLGFSLFPKRNREWTYARASELRDNIRNSMRKTKSHVTV